MGGVFRFLRRPRPTSTRAREPALAGYVARCPSCGHRRALRHRLIPTSGRFEVRCRGCRVAYETDLDGCRPVHTRRAGKRIGPPVTTDVALEPPRPEPDRHRAGLRAWSAQLLILVICVVFGAVMARSRRRSIGLVAALVGPFWLIASGLAYRAWRRRESWARRLGHTLSALQLLASVVAGGAAAVVVIEGSVVAAGWGLTDWLVHSRRGVAAGQLVLALLLAAASLRWIQVSRVVDSGELEASLTRHVAAACLLLGGITLITLAWKGTWTPSRRLTFLPLTGAILAAAGAGLAAVPLWDPSRSPGRTRRLVVVWCLLALALAGTWSWTRAELREQAAATKPVLDALHDRCRGLTLRARDVTELKPKWRGWLREKTEPAVLAYPEDDFLRQTVDRWWHRRWARPRYQDLNFCNPRFLEYLQRRIGLALE